MANPEDMTQLERDGDVISRIRIRLAKGKRVELHIDVADVAVLVRYASAAHRARVLAVGRGEG